MSREKIHTFFSQANQGAIEFAQDINHALDSISPITIHDVVVRGINRSSSSQVRLTISYEVGGTRWGAVGAVGSDNSPDNAAGALNSAFLGNPLMKGRFIRSMQGYYGRSSGSAALIVLFEYDGAGVTSDAYTAWPLWAAPRCGVAQENIAIGDTGEVLIKTRDGGDPVTVNCRNDGQIIWTNGTGGYLYRDERDQRWHGFPSCC